MKRDKTIKEAMEAGEDTTGLGTVRDLARVILERNAPYFCEMVFMLDGNRVNIEAVVTFVDGTPFGVQWKPKRSWFRNAIRKLMPND